MYLQKGDEIRIIAPSKSISSLKDPQVILAKQKLENMGFIVTFGKYVTKQDKLYKCATINERIEDLHDAFIDKNVKCIIAARGGYNVNQLLKYIDYDIIKNNPKIICGFSDIAALLNAIYTKTGLTTFCGPTFSNFAMKLGFEYTEEYFIKMLVNNEKVNVFSSNEYSDDNWYIDQENRKFIKNKGVKVINDGKCEGKIIGGNLCTLNLLQGTEFMPSLKNSILFLEESGIFDDDFLYEFDRNLESLIQTKDFKYVKGIIFGRTQNISNMTYKKWKQLIKNKKELNNIPIIIGADFGHTTPTITFPIGGHCSLVATNDSIELTIYR